MVLMPEWFIVLSMIQPPLEWPPKVCQTLYDREIQHIMRHGVPTERALLRSQGTISSAYHKPRRDRVRAALFKQQCGLCYWCQKEMTLDNNGGKFASFEHLLPRSHGGRFTPGNIVLAHKTCNHHRESKRHRLARYAHDPMRQGEWNAALQIAAEIRADPAVPGTGSGGQEVWPNGGQDWPPPGTIPLKQSRAKYAVPGGDRTSGHLSVG
jgi:hypothetical protein